MSESILTLENITGDEDVASQVAGFWDYSQTSRLEQAFMWDDIRQYVFAADTTHTTAKDTPWRNRTTRPKLTWIYDKATTSYVRKLLPNDEFFRWRSSPGKKQKNKSKAVQTWMVHKLRNKFVSFRSVVSACLSDWLLTGNAFATVEYIHKYEKNLATGEKELVFKGARPVRISPYFSGIDAKAEKWEDSNFIYKKMVRKDVFFADAEEFPDKYNKEAVENLKNAHKGGHSKEVIDYIQEKNIGIDGINIIDQWGSDHIELLVYYGPVKNALNDEYESNRYVIVGDKSFVLVNSENDSYLTDKPVVHAEFRKRPDNLWGMGPLENLLGMQYRIDHQENVKADALDACAFPIVKVTGDATSEKYELKPGAQWHVPANGDVELIYPDPGVATFESQIITMERAMEEFAGLPRETAGFRTPGEKTGFEVQSLLASAGEFPDEKLAEFESGFLEPLLNLLLELNMRNLDNFDIESLPDDAQETFGSITLADLKVDGRLYPIGIKHSKERAEKIGKILQMVQVGAEVFPEHLAKFRAAQVLSEEMNLDEDEIIEFAVGLKEAQDIQKVQQLLQRKTQQENPDAPTQSSGGEGGRQ